MWRCSAEARRSSPSLTFGMMIKCEGAVGLKGKGQRLARQNTGSFRDPTHLMSRKQYTTSSSKTGVEGMDLFNILSKIVVSIAILEAQKERERGPSFCVARARHRRYNMGLQGHKPNVATG